MDIRPATNADVPHIRALAERSWERDYDVVNRETARETVAEWYSDDRVRDDIESDDALVMVADDGDVVGFSHSVWSAEEFPEVGTVLRLYVDPERRREGVGSRLLEATRTALETHDVERVEAMVLADNEPGNDFYRTAGFEHVGTSETVIGEEIYPEHVYRYAGDCTE